MSLPDYMEEDMKPCIHPEGRARGFIKSTARYYGFCGCSRDGWCSLWNKCHGTELPKARLSWYTGQVRLNFKWHRFDAYAYSEEQAIKLLRDYIGYRCRLGKSDFFIRCVRELTADETANKKCDIKVA